jgi:hypothetical protein
MQSPSKSTTTVVNQEILPDRGLLTAEFLQGSPIFIMDIASIRSPYVSVQHRDRSSLPVLKIPSPSLATPSVLAARVPSQSGAGTRTHFNLNLNFEQLRQHDSECH